jgi:hypothetical protein
MTDAAPRLRFRDTQIEMAHGEGGTASRRLVEGLFAPLLASPSTGPLGDAMHVAVNGVNIAVIAAGDADAGLEALRNAPGGGEAVIIGEIRAEPQATVLGTTAYGGTRVIDVLVGDPLPRIC